MLFSYLIQRQENQNQNVIKGKFSVSYNFTVTNTSFTGSKSQPGEQSSQKDTPHSLHIVIRTLWIKCLLQFWNFRDTLL